jgi:hypothetical protein
VCALASTASGRGRTGPTVWTRRVALTAVAGCFLAVLGWRLGGKRAAAEDQEQATVQAGQQLEEACLGRWRRRTFPTTPLASDWTKPWSWGGVRAGRSLEVQLRCDVMALKVGCEKGCPTSDPVAAAALVREQLLALASLVPEPALLQAASASVKGPLGSDSDWIMFDSGNAGALTLKWRWVGAPGGDSDLALQVEIAVRGEWHF